MLQYAIIPTLDEKYFRGFLVMDENNYPSFRCITEKLDTIEEVKKVCRAHFKELKLKKTYFVVSEPIYGEECELCSAEAAQR